MLGRDVARLRLPRIKMLLKGSVLPVADTIAMFGMVASL